MAKSKKIIVTAALTGAIHTPGMSPYLPIGIEGISKDGIEAGLAGASIIHVHARNEDGSGSSDHEHFRKILSNIRSKTDAVLGISTGGAQGMTVEERFSVIPDLKPEMASCNTGTMNFCLAQLAENLNPKFDWEVPFLTKTKETFFKNTPSDIEYCVDIMNQSGTKPEFEVFDLGQLNNLYHIYKRGLIKGSLYIQFVPGVLGGFALTIDNIKYMIDTAKKLFGDDVMFSCVAPGRRMFRLSALSAILGGNVRVGLEDGLYSNINGEQAVSSAQQVEKIIRILNELDYEVATPDEAREMLGLKGSNYVNF